MPHIFILSCRLISLPKDQDCHELWSKRRKKYVVREAEKKIELSVESIVSQLADGSAWSPASNSSSNPRPGTLQNTPANNWGTYSCYIGFRAIQH